MPIFDNRILDRNFSESFHGRIPGELLKRVKLLREPERTLFQLLLTGNVSRRQIARMLDLPPGTITRRVQRLAARLHDPLVVALADDRCPLPRHDRELGIDHFLHGMSISQITGAHRIPSSRVRERLAFVRGWHKGLTAMTPGRA
jgi:DNA-directed RNA polymerase specialized sigma24 family protein